MQKIFHVSGILYHIPTQQILLHQSNPTSTSWSMLGGESREGEDSEKTFQRVIKDYIEVQLNTQYIYPVYDYFHETSNLIHYVFYAEVQSISAFSLPNSDILSWFTFKQTLKLPFGEQTKQDIVVTQRVINAQARSIETIIQTPVN